MESSLFFLVAVIAGGLFLLWMILYFIPRNVRVKPHQIAILFNFLSDSKGI